MAINQFQNVNVGDVAQAYSVPLEGVVDTIQRQQQLNLQQQQLRHQEQMQRQQMEMQNQDAIDAALSSVHATGTAYDEYLMQQQKNLMARTQEALRRNPMEARSIARRGAADLSYRAAQAKGLSDRIADTVTALDKQNPYYNTSLLSSELMNAALKDEKGNFREAPDVSVLNRLGEFAGNDKYYNYDRLNKATVDNFPKVWKTQEQNVRYSDRGIPMVQQVTLPDYKVYDAETGTFRLVNNPIQYDGMTINTLPTAIRNQAAQDQYAQKWIPVLKTQLAKENPRFSTLPEALQNDAALYSYVQKFGDSVPTKIDRPLINPAAEAQYKRTQDALQNSMAQQRLNNSNRMVSLAEQRQKAKEEQLADINVLKDAITGVNRNGTTREQQQALFAKNAAPPPETESLQAFLKKYSKGKELLTNYMSKSKGLGNFETQLATDLTPINISGAYSNGKVINPFNGQHGTAQLWIDPNTFKKVVVFQPTKTRKDETTGYVITVPDYDNMKVYEGDQGVRFVDQLKDSESKKGLNATDFIDNEE